MPALAPTSANELAEALRDAAAHSRTVTVLGNNSKRLMAGPVVAADELILTTALRRIITYERDDLTISVEAGMLFADLQKALAQNRQTIPLDPPFSAQATVGGVIASNSSGPMRGAFGTARDVVIGMTFATLGGELVKTGGMVVKNVAGLDIGKLMIGSFGTLAVITSVNFRVHSLPQETRTFLFTFSDLESAMEKRDAIVQSVLQPTAVDLVSPAAATRLGLRGYTLVVRIGGSRAVLNRCARELKTGEEVTGPQEASLWHTIVEFSPEFLRRQPGGVVLRISTPPGELTSFLKFVFDASISRALAGVTYVYLSSWQGVRVLWSAALERGWSAVVEFAPDEIRGAKDLWLERSSNEEANTFAMMKRIKHMFDPGKLLNRSRLYGRI